MQPQPFENCPEVPCLIVAIAQPNPAKVIRPIRVKPGSASIRLPVVQLAVEAETASPQE